MRQPIMAQGRGRGSRRIALPGILSLALALPLAAQQAPPAPAAPAAPPASAAEQKEVKTEQKEAAAPAPATPAAEAGTPEMRQPPVGSAPLVQQVDRARMGVQPAPPPPNENDWLSGYVDVGYRWVTGPGGSQAQYRTLVNLGEGLKLFGADLTFQDPKKRFFDVLTVRGIGWGGDPYTTAAIEARKNKLYDFRFDYRNIALFDAAPSFANPSAPLGFNEQTFDTRRRVADLELTLFPSSRIVPYLAYGRYSGGGRGINDWVLGASDNFPVPFLTHDRTNNYRAGVRLEGDKVHATLEQGGTTYREDDSTGYSGPERGDNPVTLGIPLSLSSLQQAYGIRGHSIYSKGLLAANPTKWINFYGQFLYSEPRTSVNYTELAGGSFVNFATLALYGAQYGVASGEAIQPRVSGLGGFEMYLGSKLRIIETITFNREHDSAYNNVNTQLLNSLATPTLVSASLAVANPYQVVNYQQQQADVYYDVTHALTLRGGFRYLWGDATVTATPLSQTGPYATGSLSRLVGIGGLIYRMSSKLRLTADYEGSSSDDIYFRTSLNNYSRGRVVAKYQPTGSLAFTANFRVLDNQNPSPTVKLDYLGRDSSLAFFWTPKAGKRITITGEYDRSTVRDHILFLDLPAYNTALSTYRENAHTATTAIDITLARGGKLTFGGSLFIGNGSRPTRYYEPLAQLLIPVYKHLSWNTVWQYYGYGESFYAYEGFRAHIFQTGLRLSR